METKKFPPYTVCHSHYVSHRQHWMATLLGGIVAPNMKNKKKQLNSMVLLQSVCWKGKNIETFNSPAKEYQTRTQVDMNSHFNSPSSVQSSHFKHNEFQERWKSAQANDRLLLLYSPLRLLSSIDYSTTIHSPLWSATVSHLYSAVQHDTTFLLVLKFDSVPHHLQTDMPPTDHHWGGVSGGEG